MTPEEGYLGAVLLQDRRYYEHPLRPEDFISARCRMVYEAIGAALDRGGRVDPALILAETKVDPAWFAGLTTDAPFDVARAAHLVMQGAKHHRLRQLVREASERIEHEDVDAVLEWVEAGLSEVAEGREDDVVDSGEMVGAMVKEFERRFKAKGEIPGITTGIHDLDEYTLGWEPERYVVVGARPSQGKSALLLNFAMAALGSGHKPGYFSIESSRYELLERAFANVGGANLSRLRNGMYGGSEAIGITRAAEYLKAHRFLIADRPNMQLSDLKARARRMVRSHGVDMLLVDYVQLVQLPGNLSDYERVSQVSVALKQLARELSVPVITAAQLNRGSEEGKTRKPRLSDFKNTGQIEQDADVAILIHHVEDNTYLCVEKNRDGACGDVQVAWDGATMRFRDFTTNYN